MKDIVIGAEYFIYYLFQFQRDEKIKEQESCLVRQAEEINARDKKITDLTVQLRNFRRSMFTFTRSMYTSDAEMQLEFELNST